MDLNCWSLRWKNAEWQTIHDWTTKTFGSSRLPWLQIVYVYYTQAITSHVYSQVFCFIWNTLIGRRGEVETGTLENERIVKTLYCFIVNIDWCQQSRVNPSFQDVDVVSTSERRRVFTGLPCMRPCFSIKILKKRTFILESYIAAFWY